MASNGRVRTGALAVALVLAVLAGPTAAGSASPDARRKLAQAGTFQYLTGGGAGWGVGVDVSNPGQTYWFRLTDGGRGCTSSAPGGNSTLWCTSAVSTTKSPDYKFSLNAKGQLLVARGATTIFTAPATAPALYQGLPSKVWGTIGANGLLYVVQGSSWDDPFGRVLVECLQTGSCNTVATLNTTTQLTLFRKAYGAAVTPRCPAGTGGPNCVDCIRGTYSAGGTPDAPTPDCTPCDAGYTTATTKATNVTACALCAAGYGAGISGSSCSLCAQGTFSPGGNATVSRPPCLACAVGRTTLSAGASTCLWCSPGYGGALCVKCSPGTFSFGGNATAPTPDCSKCPNQRTSNAGAISLDGCNIGVCPAGQAGLPCANCTAATYSPGSTVLLPVATCLNCSAGMGSPPGSTSVASCLMKCPPGTGGLGCLSCPIGKYSAGGTDANPQPECLSCQGSITLKPNSTSAASCTVGVCPLGQAGLPCANCTAGTYSPGSTALLPLAACLNCSVGMDSLQGASSCFCAAGFGWNAATLKCTQCGAGTFSPGGSLTACGPCLDAPAGASYCGCNSNRLPAVPNGSWASGSSCNNVTAGATCNATCAQGFAGSVSSACKADGQWTPISGSCVALTCARSGLPALINATWPAAPNCDKAAVGATCTATCAQGWSGTITTTCSADGTWAQAQGTCTANCAVNNGGCSKFATCAVTLAGKACTCNNGYTGDGVTCRGFTITLINKGSDTSQDAVFQAAARRWEQIIMVDVPDVPSTTWLDLSGGQFPGYTYKEAVDDIVIFYSFGNIDGPYNILGQAGPIWLRTGSNLPISAIMEFDSSDFGDGKLFGQDVFTNVVLHEMGHSLGLGTIWIEKGLMKDCVPGSNVNNYYLGANAQREYNNLGCTGLLPIETAMGEGSGCAHWRESTLKTELMTPMANRGAMPLSRITIGGFEDLYGSGNVDYSTADAFDCKTGLPASVSANKTAAAAMASALATALPLQPYLELLKPNPQTVDL